MKRIMWIVLCIVMMISCTPGSGTRSGSFLVITSILSEDGKSSVITSDVLKGGFVFDDKGTVTLTAYLYDPISPVGNSAYNDVIVDQVDVEYSRSDGRDVEGKDVPYSFSQPVDLYVAINASGTVMPVVIRHMAKLEPPLVDLVPLSQEAILYLNCKITVYARDVGGARLKPVSGSVQIQCANFGDES